MPFGKTFSVPESAAYLRVSTKSIRRYLKKGLLKSKIVPGKHGEELRIFKRSLDKVAGEIKTLSREKADIFEFNRLYQEATPEVREVVLKILRSHNEGEEIRKPEGLIASIFKLRS